MRYKAAIVVEVKLIKIKWKYKELWDKTAISINKFSNYVILSCNYKKVKVIIERYKVKLWDIISPYQEGLICEI